MWMVFEKPNGRFVLQRDDGLPFMRLRGMKLVRRSWPDFLSAMSFASALNLVNK